MCLHVYVSECRFVHAHVVPKEARRGRKIPGAGVETVVSCLRWMLAIKLALVQLRSALWALRHIVLSKSRETVIALVTFM